MVFGRHLEGIKSRSSWDKSSQNRSSRDRSSQDRSSQDWSSQDRSSQARTDNAMAWQDKSDQINFGTHNKCFKLKRFHIRKFLCPKLCLFGLMMF